MDDTDKQSSRETTLVCVEVLKSFSFSYTLALSVTYDSFMISNLKESLKEWMLKL